MVATIEESRDFERRVMRSEHVTARHVYAKCKKFKRKEKAKNRSLRLFKHILPEELGIPSIDSRSEFGCNARNYTYSEWEIERHINRRLARLARWPFNRYGEIL